MHFKAILFTQQTPQAPSYYCTDISTTPQRYKNKWFGGSRSIIIPLNVLTGGRERTYDLPLAICVRHLDKSQARWYIFVPGRRKDRDRWSFESLHELPRLYFKWVIYITSYYNRRSIFGPPKNPPDFWRHSRSKNSLADPTQIIIFCSDFSTDVEIDYAGGKLRPLAMTLRRDMHIAKSSLPPSEGSCAAFGAGGAPSLLRGIGEDNTVIAVRCLRSRQRNNQSYMPVWIQSIISDFVYYRFYWVLL